MNAERIVDVFPAFAAQANITSDEYEKLYAQSIKDPAGFWGEQAKRLHWFKPWETVVEHDFAQAQAEWFKGGQLNVSYNCLDRHLDSDADRIAIIWEGDDPAQNKSFTYGEVHAAVCQMANILKSQGVKKGDRVLIYLPMIPELGFATLACARIGAVHSVVFGGFSPDSLRDRIDDCKPKLVITSDGGYRGGKSIDMKKNIDIAQGQCAHPADTVVVIKRTGQDVDWNQDTDRWYEDLASGASTDCPAEPMAAEDPLFILYTSGSTGKPKGVLHTTAGYLLGAALSHYYVFDHKEDDIYWCTADIGWITGHSYIIYGPLCNKATTIMFEGVPTYPDAGRFWDIVDKYKVSVFYTAPTAIRALSSHGPEPVQKRDLSSLRLLGTVGEPINPEAWEWYFDVVGKKKCPIVDTWWQTETGSIMITPLPGVTALKPGSATKPFFGIKPVLVDNDGQEIGGDGEAAGNLCISAPWPSMIRAVYGDPERVFKVYFAQFPGYYFTGDGCRRDADGYYWITGRVDDVLNVSGHRIGSAEVESALVAHPAVAEAAVVGYPHDVKGQGIYAYVTTQKGVDTTEALQKDLIDMVSKHIGKIARPEIIHFTPGLPKTRSGKIMRRILRKIAEGEYDKLGDTTTLADPAVVETLVEFRKSLTL